jgi:hypothetical protein
VPLCSLLVQNRLPEYTELRRNMLAGENQSSAFVVPEITDKKIAAGYDESRRLKALEKEEPLLIENPRRFVVLPIHYPDIWQYYKKAEGTSNFLFE